MERINKLYIIIGLVIAFGLFFGIAAYADEADQATTITFSEPVEIPGQVLPAGSYLFKLVNNGSDTDVVRIFSSDGRVLYATLLTDATDRQRPTGNTVITLAEQSGAPDALLKWFYPGNLTGSKFVYPGHEEKQLARNVQKTLVVTPNAHTSEVHAAD
jgi:hypothetical protein